MLTDVCCTVLPRQSKVIVERLKKGATITAAVLAGLASLFICVLILYRKRLKRQQTIYPATHNSAADNCWDDESGSDGRNSDCDE